MRQLRIAQIAPPLERVPPRAYGGTERVIFELINELMARGHEVTLFASGDSSVPCELVPTVLEALRPLGFGGDPSPYFLLTIQEVLRRASEFDVIHSHLEWSSLLLAAATTVPVVSTFHGRLDFDYSRRLLNDRPGGLVAISRSQASVHPEQRWTVIHNGLTLDRMPFERRRSDDLCFVGRIAPEKGIMEAMEVARLSGRKLTIAAKIGTIPVERAYYDEVFKPALGKADVEFLGEVSPEERDRIFASSYAFVSPGAWPEPFGLVTIESLACGTPVIGRRVGATPEIVRDGLDGFFADDVRHMAFLLDKVKDLDRAEIRRSVIERFSAARMADAYEQLYLRRLGEIAIETRDAANAAGAIPLATARIAAAARNGNPIGAASDGLAGEATGEASGDATEEPIDLPLAASGGSATESASADPAGSISAAGVQSLGSTGLFRRRRDGA